MVSVTLDMPETLAFEVAGSLDGAEGLHRIEESYAEALRRPLAVRKPPDS